jgi:hypothetical protein
MYMKDKNKSRRKRYGENPMGGVANLFVITPDHDVTIVKNPGESTMEVIVKSGQEITTLNMSETMAEEDVVGTVGTIYEMKGGGMIYVPSK